MEILEWIIIAVALLGLLFGAVVLIRALVSSDWDTWKRMFRSPTFLLTMLTVISCGLAVLFDNFFYDIPAIPLSIAAVAVLSLSRHATKASLCSRKRWLSVVTALSWGIWSFCVFILLVVILIPDYPGLNQYTTHQQLGFAYLLVGMSVAVMLLSSAINVVVGIRATRKQRKEEY